MKEEIASKKAAEAHAQATEHLSWPDAVAQANDGWGPYLPVLVVTGQRDSQGEELIPGKFCTSKNCAFYSKGGGEHKANKWRVVKGKMYPKGR